MYLSTYPNLGQTQFINELTLMDLRRVVTNGINPDSKYPASSDDCSHKSMITLFCLVVVIQGRGSSGSKEINRTGGQKSYSLNLQMYPKLNVRYNNM